MDPGGFDDGGGGRKMGLARLAKACSLSSSLNNLNNIEKKLENREDCNSLNEDGKSPEHISEVQISPSRTLGKQSGAVSLLPNKINVSALSGHQSTERRNRGCSLDGSLHSFELTGQSVPCSDPDFIKTSKTASMRTSQSQAFTSQRTSYSVDKPSDRESHSPLLAHRTSLSPPQIKRSSSMTRLSEAINQIHNICVFPAQPLVVTEKSEVSKEGSMTSPKSITTCPPVSEVMCFGSLTPLVATSCRNDKDRTQSPNLARCSAFRKSLKEHRTPCTESLHMPIFQPSVCHNHGRTYSPPSISAPKDCNLKGFSNSLTNLLDDDLCGVIPLKTNSLFCSDSSKTSNSNHGIPPYANSLEMSQTRRISQDLESEKYNQKKNTHDHKYIKKSTSSPSNLRQATISSSMENVLKQCEEQYRMSPLLQAHEVFKQEESALQNCRSASLDELNNLHTLPGLPLISPSDAKKRNYLFGGLGNGNLLGSKELDRYFPNRVINIFIATWNMNGKEPPANLEEFLLPEAMEHIPDMYVVGTQESGGSRSEWEVRLQATIGPSHVLFTSSVFGVLHLTIFLRRDLLWFCSVPEEDTYSVRPGIAYKTKGGMGIGFQFFGTRLLFINSHLTAHEEKQALRVQNFRNICHSLDLPRLLPQKSKNKDVTQRYDCVFWLGDLNFRLAVNRDHVFERLKRAGPETYLHLLQWDQLSQARNKGEAFSEFEEGPITFAPTFKYDPGTDHYDTSSKQRVPSYTDRILFKSSRGSVTCCNYDSCPLFRTSDHKPVSGIFQCKIRPGKDDVPLAAGLFNRDVYLEALRRRKRFMYQPALRNCPVQ